MPLHDLADQIYLTCVLALAELADGDIRAARQHMKNARDLAYCADVDNEQLFEVIDFMPDPVWLEDIDLRDPPC